MVFPEKPLYLIKLFLWLPHASQVPTEKGNHHLLSIHLVFARHCTKPLHRLFYSILTASLRVDIIILSLQKGNLRLRKATAGSS